MLKQFKGTEKTYKLSLSDNITWSFKATETISPWLEKFADIMQLDETDEETFDRNLLFLALKHDNSLSAISKVGNWNHYKQGVVYKIWSHDNHPENFIELNLDYINHPEIKFVNMWSSLKPLYRYYVVKNEGGPIHAALAEFNGKGILIAAQGGTGKSTCSIRLPSYWKPLSDDMALIVKDNENNYRAHPMPTWSDHLWKRRKSKFNASYSVPLKAVFFLEQSDKDDIIPINSTTGAQRIFESCKQVWDSYWKKVSREEEKHMVNKVFNNAFDLAVKTPCYKLKATLNGKFWELIEALLKN
jgi:SynChlorMet cassette protein ScmC